MTNDKNPISKTMWVVFILVALAFGAFLGSPLPDALAEQITEAAEAISKQTTAAISLHSITKEVIAKEETAKSKRTVPELEEEGDIKAVVSDPLPGTEILIASQSDYIVYNPSRSGTVDRKELDVLVHLINAEAYGLSYKAKVAVGQVVMNRWKGPHYGDDLLAIMTAPYQFTPIYNGSAYKKSIELDSIEAANAVLSGKGVDGLTDDTYYFVNPDFTEDKTIETKMEFVCEIEGIHFFKPPK